MKPLAHLVGACALVAAAPLPRIVAQPNGRHIFLVGGEPFPMLGGQANNSSNYSAMLPKVWPVIHALHANTLEMPVAWEQVEPVEGRFDFSFFGRKWSHRACRGGGASTRPVGGSCRASGTATRPITASTSPASRCCFA